MKNLLLIALLVNPLHANLIEPVNQAPSICVYYKTQEIEDDLWMAEDGFIDVKIEDTNFKSASIEVDGKTQTIDEESHILIEKSKQFITIVAFDSEGLETVRTIRIHSVNAPVLSSSIKGDITRESKVELMVSECKQSDWNLVISYDGIEDRMEAISHLELARNGLYEIFLENKENPSLQSNHLIFTYSNQRPSIHLEPSSTYSNQNVEVNVLLDGDFIQSSVLKIRNGNTEQIIENTDSITLERVEGCDLVYEIEGIVEDAFQETSSDRIQVRIDALAPSLDLLNGTQRMDESFIYRAGMNLAIQSDGQVSISYKQNGLPVYYASIKEALDHLSSNDSLELFVQSSDELGNIVQKTWTIKKENLLKPLVTNNLNQVELKDTIADHEQYIINHRTWSVDENQQLHLEQKNQKIIKPSKPKISVFTKEKNQNLICRIVLYQSEKGSNQFNWIRIDGKNINLKKCEKDQFGNVYYEFFTKKSCKIECKAENKEGKTRTIKKTINYSKNKKMSFFQWFKQWLKRMHG